MGSLRDDLERLDNRPYPAYRDLRGRVYPVGPYGLCLEHVQGDPFASPSRLCVAVEADSVGLSERALSTPVARRATADFLHRALKVQLGRREGERHQESRGHGGGRGRGRGRGGGGSGKSGQIGILSFGPEVLERSALLVSPDGALTVRLTVGMPAAGRRILGRAAAQLLTSTLIDALQDALGRDNVDQRALERHIEVVEDQVSLRSQLRERGLVAFVAEDSVLPRRSGVDSRPLPDALPLEVPDGLSVVLDAPHAGPIRGLAVREGITLIVGGGYHGKSTLLSVLSNGVYDHMPGDGRERAVTREDALWIRAEDGRSIRGVNLSPFINNLPLKRDTTRFDSDDASGSTSQAAAVMEGLEVGVGAFLIDEDTAATNFMIRDARMRRLIPSHSEPITPYLDRVRQLYDEFGVSSVLVVGGAGDYLDVADHVIQMEAYRPRDVSERASEVARSLPLGAAAPKAPSTLDPPAPRVVDPRSLDPSSGRRAERVRSVKTRAIEFGREEIDVSLLAQLVDPAQARMIGDALLVMSRGECDGRQSIQQVLDALERSLDERGIFAVCGRTLGDRARPRRLEIAAALNRLRSLRLVS